MTGIEMKLVLFVNEGFEGCAEIPSKEQERKEQIEVQNREVSCGVRSAKQKAFEQNLFDARRRGAAHSTVVTSSSAAGDSHSTCELSLSLSLSLSCSSRSHSHLHLSLPSVHIHIANTFIYLYFNKLR